MSEDASPPMQRPGGASSWRSSGFVPPSVAELQPGFEGQYEILSLLGSGGMGTVYQARQIRLDRMVALKVLPGVMREGPDFVKRFEREAQVMAKLKHPLIVSLYDFGETPGGLLYIAMELVPGRTLQELIDERSLTQDQALAIIAQICEALNYAHGLGFVHRDIKPQNIMIDPGHHIKIMDFGLAKSLHGGASLLTLTDERFGTLDYAAPEQMAGDAEVDHRADIYALGVLFYQLLTGSVPRGNFATPSQTDRSLDPRLDDLVLRAMQPEPDTRFQEVSEFWTQLEHIRTSTIPHPAAAPREVSPATAATPRRAGPRGVVTAMATALGVVVLGLGGWWMSHPAPQPSGLPPEAPTTSVPTPIPAPAPPMEIPVAATPPAAAPRDAPAPAPAATVAVVPTPMVPPPVVPPPVVVEPVAVAPVVVPADVVPAPPANPSAAVSEVDARLGEIEARFQEAMSRDVIRPHEQAVAKLTAQYTAALERTAAGGLPPAEAAAFRSEIGRIQAQPPSGELKVEPETVPAIPALAAMRATYRDSLAKLKRARDLRAQPVEAGYDRLLSDYQTELTKQGRIDDALKLKATRAAAALAARPPEATPPAAPAAVATVSVPASPAAGPPPARPAPGLQRELAPLEWALSVAATLGLEKDGQPVTAGSAGEIVRERYDVVSATFPTTAELTDADLLRLARWKKLRTFEAAGTHRMTDEGLRVLRNMEQLSEFKLHGPCNGITDAGLAHLGNCKGLSWLILNTTGITGTGFAKMRECTNLQVINLTNAPVTGSGLKQLEKFPNLVNLMLVNNSALRDEDLAAFKPPPPLLLLDLTGCSGITGKGLAAVKGIKSVMPPKP